MKTKNTKELFRRCGFNEGMYNSLPDFHKRAQLQSLLTALSEAAFDLDKLLIKWNGFHEIVLKVKFKEQPLKTYRFDFRKTNALLESVEGEEE